MPRLWWLVLSVSVLAAACSSGEVPGSSSGQDSPAIATTSVASTQPTTTTVAPSTTRNTATWPLIDTVPAFRKAGVLVAAGLDYEPILDEMSRQAAARFTMRATSGVFGLAPERGMVSFDGMQVGEVAGDGTVWPWLISEAGTLHVFPDNPNRCGSVPAGSDFFASFGVDGDVDGTFAFSAVECSGNRSGGGWIEAQLPERIDGVRSFGLLISDAEVGATVEAGWLALTDSAAAVAETVRVTLVGTDRTIAARSADPADDASLGVLYVLRDDGSLVEFSAGSDGSFTFERAELGARAKLWIEDYDLGHFVAQGPWIDPTNLVGDLVIDFTPSFEPVDTPPPPSISSSHPHTLQIRNGVGKEVQQYQFHGVNWNNNLGFADRDRDAANPNGCERAAWFGGSHVLAKQTRVDQKPGVIAEALLDVAGQNCHEVFTVGRPRHGPDNHIGDARRLIHDFGVRHLIFSVSENEICKMFDPIYSMIWNVAADTPVHWRLIDGEAVAPVTRRRAEPSSLPPDFERPAACSFDADASPEAQVAAKESIDKLAQLKALLEAEADGVVVSFLAMKDPLAGRSGTVELILEECVRAGIDCVSLAAPNSTNKPDDVAEVDINPFLYRFVGDGHPNARANQQTAVGLVEVIAGLDERRSP